MLAHWKRAIAVGIAVTTALTGAGACGSEPDAEQEALQVVRELFTEMNAGHRKAASALLADSALEDFGYANRTEFVAEEHDDSSMVEIRRVASVRKRSERRVVVTVDFRSTPIRLVGVEDRYSFTVTKTDRWRISRTKYEQAPVTSASKPLIVGAYEYRFDVPPVVRPFSAVVLQNHGVESHALHIVRADTDMTEGEIIAVIKAHTQSDFQNEDVEGFTSEFMTWVDDPGQTKAVRFTRPMAKGVYYFVCYHPQGDIKGAEPPPDDAPSHAELGMISKVVVE